MSFDREAKGKQREETIPTRPVAREPPQFRWEDNMQNSFLEPFRLNCVEPELLFLKLKDTKGKIWEHRRHTFQPPKWDDPKWITESNKWHTEIIYNKLVKPDYKDSKKKSKTPWSEMEKGIVGGLILQQIQKTKEALTWSDWAEVTEDFNSYFEYFVLPAGQPMVGRIKRSAKMAKQSEEGDDEEKEEQVKAPTPRLFLRKSRFVMRTRPGIVASVRRWPDTLERMRLEVAKFAGQNTDEKSTGENNTDGNSAISDNRQVDENEDYEDNNTGAGEPYHDEGVVHHNGIDMVYVDDTDDADYTDVTEYIDDTDDEEEVEGHGMDVIDDEEGAEDYGMDNMDDEEGAEDSSIDDMDDEEGAEDYGMDDTDEEERAKCQVPNEKKDESNGILLSGSSLTKPIRDVLAVMVKWEGQLGVPTQIISQVLAAWGNNPEESVNQVLAVLAAKGDDPSEFVNLVNVISGVLVTRGISDDVTDSGCKVMAQLFMEREALHEFAEKRKAKKRKAAQEKETMRKLTSKK